MRLLFWTHSIQREVQKAQAQWLAENSYFKKFSLSKIDRALLFMGESPVRFITLLLSGLLFLCIGAYWYSPQIPDSLWSVDSSHFGTLWAVQATLAALVYPIVIAFVTVFLQRRPAAGAFVHVYILDSGALVAGLSSLALVAAMAGQFVVLPGVESSVQKVWLAFNGIWFSINAFLTIVFLYRTIEFLSPAVQERVMQRYAIQVALPREVSRHNAFQVYARFQSEGKFPVEDYEKQSAPTGPRIEFHDFAYKKGDVSCAVWLRQPARLHNINLGLLRAVLNGWLQDASRSTPTPTPTPTPTQASESEDPEFPVLSISINPGLTYTDEAILARVRNGPTLRPWHRLMLRCSLTWAPAQREKSWIQVLELLQELERDAQDAARRSDNGAFRNSYRALLEMHELLIGASIFKGVDGRTESWAMLPDISKYFDRTLHASWAGIYRSVGEAAIEAIQHDANLVQYMCHLVRHLDSDDLRKCPPQMRQEVLELPTRLMYQISTWWNRRVEEQGVIHHDHEESASLRPPLGRTYEEVLSEFVGGWETARLLLVDVPDSSDSFAWSDAEAIGDLAMVHVKETAKMMLAAAMRGDIAAAEWFGDVLLKWWGNIGADHEPFELYYVRDYLTLQHLQMPWEQVSDVIGASGAIVRERIDRLQRAVVRVAVRNMWVDILTLTIELLLSLVNRPAQRSPQDCLAFNLAVGLLSGKAWRGGGSSSETLSGYKADDYLGVKVRQYGAEGNVRNGYIGRLNSFVERIKDLRRPAMVSSRIYSLVGADNMSSLGRIQTVLLALFSVTEWTLSKSTERQIDSWMSGSTRSLDKVRQFTKEWLQLHEDIDESSLQILRALIQALGKSQTVEDAVRRGKSGTNSLVDYLDRQHDKAVELADIDNDRLVQLARYASRTAFDRDAGCFPLPLMNVELGHEDQENFSLTLQQVKKGELTAIEFESHAINEDDFWDKTMREHVGARILTDVVKATDIREVSTPNPEAYWTVLRQEAQSMAARGEHPVLVLDNRTRPEWVWKWRHPEDGSEYPRPADLNIRRDTGLGDGYVCHFNEIAVYTGYLPFGQSIILPRESFDKVRFKQFEPGRCVNMEVILRLDSNRLVDLKAVFSRHVSSQKRNGVRLLYGKNAIQ